MYLAEVGISLLTETAGKRKEEWKGQMQRMYEERIPKVARQYKPISKREIGGPLKIWLEVEFLIHNLLKPEQVHDA